MENRCLANVQWDTGIISPQQGTLCIDAIIGIGVEAVVVMRSFWWLFGLLFICTFTVYTVGRGWLTAVSVKSAVGHAGRQLEPEKIVADMHEAQQALQEHRARVIAFDFIFSEPDFTSTVATYQQLEQFRRQFQALRGYGDEDAALAPGFRARIEQLKDYRVPSLSVMSSNMERGLGAASIVLGVIALLLMGVRFMGTQ